MGNLKWGKLGELFDVKDGTHESPKYLNDKSGYPLVTSKNIKNDKLILDNCNYISEIDYININKRSKVDIHDIIMPMIGTIGNPCIITEEPNYAIKNVALFKPKDNNPKFLFYWLKSDFIKNKFKNDSRGGTQKFVSLKYLRNLPFPLLSIEQQKNVAQRLDKVQELIELRKNSIKKLDELSKALFVDMFGDPVENKMEWEVVELNTVCEEIVDCINRTAPLSDKPTPYKMIRTTNVKNYKIIFNETRYVKEDVYKQWIRRLKPKKSDIVFTREAPMGEAGIITTNEDLFLGQRTMLFRPNNKLNSYYLLYELMGTNIYRQISKMSSGSTVKHLSVPKCKKFKINLPPLPLQQKFAKTIEKIEAQKALYEEELKGFEDLFESLLSESFA